MDEKILSDISRKLSALISISLRHLVADKEFGSKRGRKQGIGEQARYLADLGLDSRDIAKILDAPVASVRTLLTPKRRK